MAATSIEWCDRVWNPVTGCTKIAQGCKHCYAEAIAKRFWKGRPFSDVQCHADRLCDPNHWRKSSRIFVNSMSDLFHEAVPAQFIARVFDTMASTPRHTFIVLTKRPRRMREVVVQFADRHTAQDGSGWPLSNVVLGVSASTQKDLDELLPELLETPAACRALSLEPLIGSIDLNLAFFGFCPDHDFSGGFCVQRHHEGVHHLGWVIVGGESGPGARPCDVAWVRSIVQQCRARSCPVFVKQLGSMAVSPGGCTGWPHGVSVLRDGRVLGSSSKCNDMWEWPQDLRVREWPGLAVPAC